MIPPAFILVRPQMGENIGAAARAMLSFLVVVTVVWAFVKITTRRREG